jgi:hypothetical protein
LEGRVPLYRRSPGMNRLERPKEQLQTDFVRR